MLAAESREPEADIFILSRITFSPQQLFDEFSEVIPIKEETAHDQAWNFVTESKIPWFSL